ncbi:helix-turn-helix transcriptional regulator [Metallibacterium scheffleri]|nr:helix-turn-helix domain-containing protein [Metallibacterium scheffleri]
MEPSNQQHSTPPSSMPPQPPLAPGDLIDEHEAAAILGVSIQTLRNWRWRNCGPHYRKVGSRLVRYLRSDLLVFIESGIH